MFFPFSQNFAYLQIKQYCHPTYIIDECSKGVLAVLKDCHKSWQGECSSSVLDASSSTLSDSIENASGETELLNSKAK